MSSRPIDKNAAGKSPADQNPADALAASVRTRLAAGRSMAALKEAKELVKRYPGKAADALLAQAYQARIAELAKQGLHEEARGVLQIAAARFPAESATWQRAGVQASRVAGDLDDLLLAWRDNQDDDARHKISAELRSAVRDPSAIVDSAVLAADEPLRVAARAVQVAFTEAADGHLSAAAREGLRNVGRRSPLLPWRQFVLALDAFHRHDDAVALQQLEPIADDSGVARGKQILLDVLRATPLRQEKAPVRQVVQRVTDGLVELYAPLATLQHADPEPRVRREAARTLLLGLAPRRPRLAARLVSFLRRSSKDEALIDELDAKLGEQLFGQAEWARLIADLDAQHDVVVGLIDWLEWLMPTKGHDLRRLTDIELAELLAHMAPMGIAAQREVDKLLGAEFVAAMTDARMLDALIEPMFDKPIARRVETCLACAQMTSNAVARLRRRTGVTPRTTGMAQLLEHAVALDPTAERFALLLDLAAATPAVGQVFLEHWAQALPHDAEPLVRLAELAEERGALAQALDLITRAEAVNAVDERVRTARVRLRILRLRQHHKVGKPHLCAIDLEELAADPAAQTPLRRAYIVAARRVVNLVDDDAVRAAVGDAERAMATVALVRADLERLPTPVEVVADDMRRRLEIMAWLARVADVAQIDGAQIGKVAGAMASEDMPGDDADRLALCQVGEAHGNWRLVALAAGRGLLADGPLLGRFLLFKAKAATAEHDSARAHDLRLLARACAARSGDGAIARAAAASLPPDVEDLDSERAAKLLADERTRERGGRVSAPSPTPTVRPPRPRKIANQGPQLPFGEPRAPVEPDA